jgi:hypothetical protein
MPEISVTDFADFVLKVGVSRIQKVAEIHQRGAYDPAKDYWKLLRDCIQDHHAKGTELSLINTRAHEKKHALYSAAIKGYKKFLKTNSSGYFKAHTALWTFEDLTIRVNPEVGFSIGGKQHLVKLYFKADTLSRARIQSVIGLMSAAYKSKNFIPAILDVRRSKLHTVQTLPKHLDALLKAEAIAFLTIWNSLGPQSMP